MDEPLEVEIEFRSQDGFCVSESLPVTHLGGNHYRAEGSAIFGEELYWHDELEIECTNEGRGRFVRVLKRSGLRVESFVISKKITDSERLRDLFDAVVESGGNWEIIYGGVLLTHVPAEVEMDVDRLLSQVIADVNSGAR